MSKDHFHLYKIFKKGAHVTITKREIAKLYGISLKEVSEYIQKDVEAKMIHFLPFSSTFYLTPRGFEYLYCLRIDELSSCKSNNTI